MKSLKKREDSERQQVDRFIETARQLGVGEDEEAFKAKLKRVATAKPMKKPSFNE